MFTLIASFLKTHWQTALLASLVFSVAATFSLQRLEIRHLKRELAECHGENAALEASNKALLSSVSDQNAAIASLQSLAAARRKAAASAIASARARAVSYDLGARRISARQPSKDDCADMRALVDDFVRGP